MEKEVYVITAWFEEEGVTHFIFSREINYAPMFGINWRIDN